MCEFKVGDVVVCINDKFSPWFTKDINCPKLHQVLTVRSMRPSCEKGQTALLFHEIHNSIFKPTGNEYGFRHFRFRPAKTVNISMLTALLKTKEIAS